ncbi:uncharacterized protein LOC144628908 isoform X1 [Oculina patagonica]
METLHSLTVGILLALCMMPSAFTLKCGVCSNEPGNPGVAACDSNNVGNWTCPQDWDRCMIAKVNYTADNASIELTIGNCTSTLGCNPSSQYYACNYMNDTGGLISCSVTTCCEGDMCNVASHTSTMSPTTKPSTAYSATMETTSAVLGLAASFGATLLVLALTMLV